MAICPYMAVRFWRSPYIAMLIYGNFVHFWQFFPFLTIFGNFIHYYLTIFDDGNFIHFFGWRIPYMEMSIFSNFSYFLTIFDNLS